MYKIEPLGRSLQQSRRFPGQRSLFHFGFPPENAGPEDKKPGINTIISIDPEEWLIRNK